MVAIPDAVRALRRTAARQDAVLTRADVRRSGVGAADVRRWLRRGEWVALLTGCYLTEPGRTGTALDRSRARAAVLALPRAVLGLATASGLLGLDGARLAAERRGSLAGADLRALADPLAESALESRVRLRCVDGGTPPDALQLVVRDATGRFPGRADAAFRRRRTRPGLLLEADARSVHDLPQALHRDCERADALVAAGHDLLRCTWADALVPGRIPATVRAAL